MHVLQNSKKKGRRSSTSAVNRAAYRLCACLAFFIRNVSNPALECIQLCVEAQEATFPLLHDLEM